MFGFLKRLWAEHEAFQARKRAAAEEKAAAEELAAVELRAKQRGIYDRLPVYSPTIACPTCGHRTSSRKLQSPGDYPYEVVRVDCSDCCSYFHCRPVQHVPPLAPAKGAKKRG